MSEVESFCDQQNMEIPGIRVREIRKSIFQKYIRKHSTGAPADVVHILRTMLKQK